MNPAESIQGECLSVVADNLPCVSIIINNYNYGAFLRQCISSALAQNYANFEVIVVDDGSTDGSREIILSFGAQIRSVFKVNGGQGSALNHGVAEAIGELVLFLDSDDFLFPNCLDSVVANWRPAFSKLHFNLSVVDGSGIQLGRSYMRSLPAGDQSWGILRYGTVKTMPMSGNVFAKWFLQKVMPITPEERWRRAADVYLFNLAALAGPIGAIQDPLGAYRVHGTNVSGMLASTGAISSERLRQILLREIYTEELIVQWAGAFEKKFELGTLTSALPHTQLLIIQQKLFGSQCSSTLAFRRPNFLDFIGRLLLERNFKPIKRLILASWMTCLWCLPRPIASRLAAFGYRRRMFLAIAPA